MAFVHKPVLLEESINGLVIKPDGIYIDGTFGQGGHSQQILQRLGPDGRLLAIDKDPAAIAIAKKGPFLDSRFQIQYGSFANLETWVDQLGWRGNVDGVLLDLGVSSPQLDDAQRGFSFLREGPLDMRMNPAVGESAAEWLARAKEQEIAVILRDYGEERFARRIAGAIVRARQTHPITTTTQLAELIAKSVPSHEKHKHPATRSFQAIRIHINSELDELKSCLAQCLAILAVGGRLCVISFHSLEDRIVKRFIQQQSTPTELPGLPLMENQLKRRLKKIGSLIRASEQEIQQNVRARSARLRIAEKLA